MEVKWKRGFDKSDVTENNSISLAQVELHNAKTYLTEQLNLHYTCSIAHNAQVVCTGSIALVVLHR